MSKFQPDDIIKYLNSNQSVIGIIVNLVPDTECKKEIYRVRVILHENSELIGYIDFKHEDNLELLCNK